MARARFGSRTLGACLLAVLGLSAFMAGGAQGSWLVGEGLLVDEKPLKAQAHNELILNVPSKLLEKLCTEVHLGGGSKVSPFPLSYMLLVLHLENCQTISQHKVVPGCKPTEPVVMKAHGTLIHHGGEDYLLLTPDDAVNNRFGRLDFPVATCALPDTNLSGSIVLQCLTQALSQSGTCLSHEKSHLVSEAPSVLFPGHGLLYGASAATLSGILNLELTSGENWSGHA